MEILMPPPKKQRRGDFLKLLAGGAKTQMKM